jgi:hypothetical protein
MDVERLLIIPLEWGGIRGISLLSIPGGGRRGASSADDWSIVGGREARR